MWARVRSSVHALVRRRRFEDDMADELRFHIEHYAADLVRAGLPPDEAARRARLEFGSIDSAKTDCRQAFGLRLFDDLQQHVRFAVRLMRKTPGFTATALVTLALCLGANLTIFAIVDSVLLRPLPFPDAGRLVRVFNTYPKAGVLDDGASVTNYYERRSRVAAFSSLALYRPGTATVGESGATEREAIARVSPEFFATLGLGPVTGRAFTEEETTRQTDRVAILTDAYWRQRLNADPQAIGRRIRVDGTARTVVGVLPARFGFLSSNARIYLPLSSNPQDRAAVQRHSGSSSQMIARLAPGATVADAQAEIDRHNAAVEAGSPQARAMADAGFRSLVVMLRADHVASIRPTLMLLQAGVLCLLLIGVVNVTNLLLIRASGRAKELAVRQAIGASRRHVVGEVLAETIVLTAGGGLLALAAGAAGIRLLNLLGADQLPMGAHIAFDARSAAVTLATSFAAGIAIGLPIAWYHLRAHPMHGLQLESRGGTASRSAQRLRHAFLVAQIALSFVLLAGATLLSLSVRHALAVAPGFRPENVLSGQISLPGANYRSAGSRIAFTGTLVEQLARQPGIVAAGIVTNVPFSGNTIKSAATVKGHTLRPGESLHGHYSYGVTGDFFAALTVPLIEGRFLDTNDSRRDARVTVVDEDFARRYWPQGGAIGQRLFQGGEEQSDAEAFTVVGVVGAMKQAGLTEDEAQGAVYYPYSARLDGDLFIVTRTLLRPESLATTVRQVVRGIDAELAVSDVRTMQSRIATSLVSRRSPALLAALFSAIALLLTAVGTYGVSSYAVEQRRREIGLRIALGARPDQIRAQFVSLAVRLLAAGIAVGVAGAWLSGHAMQAMLFHVPALDLVALAVTASAIVAVCLAGCILPSRRAARISPMEALADT
jgi:putative ABC transport system permease protein